MGALLFIVFVCLPILVLAYLIYDFIMQKLLFKAGHNPASRICRKCGAHQNLFTYNIAGYHDNWWEQVSLGANDPHCKCHKHAEYRSLL